MNELFFLRKAMREKRNSLAQEFRHAAEKSMLNNFKKIKNIHNIQNIGVYMAFDGEVDLKNIIDWCWSENKKIFLPVVQEGRNNKKLIFCEYNQHGKLIKNKFNILEPEDKNSISVEEMELLLLPLTAFDRQGHRLGMGAGYYDATLQGLKKCPLLIGVGFGFQEVEGLVPHAGDVKLDGVLTEKGLLLTKS